MVGTVILVSWNSIDQWLIDVFLPFWGEKARGRLQHYVPTMIDVCFGDSPFA